MCFTEEQPCESTPRCAMASTLLVPACGPLSPKHPPRHLDMPARPLELDGVPAALSVEGGDAAVAAVELRPRLHPADANALPCSERLLGCGWACPVSPGWGCCIARCGSCHVALRGGFAGVVLQGATRSSQG